MTANLYFFFKDSLKHEFLEPMDTPDMSNFCLVDMFHRHTENTIKSNIIKSFSLCSSIPLRIVICTLAFGMGIDCPDVQKVIHYKPPNNTKSYIQNRALWKEWITLWSNTCNQKRNIQNSSSQHEKLYLQWDLL